MRLSSNQIYTQRVDNITSSQSRWMTEGNKISSGRRVEKPSDDPMAASQAVMVKQSEARNQQYATARGFAKNSMSLQMSLSSQMVNITTKIQETLVAAGNDGALSDEDRASLAIRKMVLDVMFLLVSKQINHLLLLTKRVKSPIKVETSKLLKKLIAILKWYPTLQG